MDETTAYLLLLVAGLVPLQLLMWGAKERVKVLEKKLSELELGLMARRSR